jgi:hypothetical protein
MALTFSAEQKQAWIWLTPGILFTVPRRVLAPVLAHFNAVAVLAPARGRAIDWLPVYRAGRSPLPCSVAIMIPSE